MTSGSACVTEQDPVSKTKKKKEKNTGWGRREGGGNEREGLSKLEFFQNKRLRSWLWWPTPITPGLGG